MYIVVDWMNCSNGAIYCCFESSEFTNYKLNYPIIQRFLPKKFS